MNVLFISKYDVLVGGVAEVFASLSAALRPLGVGVAIYSSHPSAEIGHLSDGTPCIHGPLPKPGLLGRRRGLRRLIALIRQRKIDLLHGHGLYRGGWAARLAGRSTGVPYIVTSHGDVLAGASRRARRRSFVRRCGVILQDAVAITHLTEAMADEAARFADVADKSTIIPNGVDLSRWRAGGQVVEGQGYLLAAGRLHEQKGFAALLEAVAVLARRGAGVPLVLAGSGPAEETLRHQASQFGLVCHDSVGALLRLGAGVCMPGYVEDQAKLDLFRRSLAVAVPSLYGEGLPVVVLEAMAASKAVIASDLPATRSLISHEHNGLVVAPGDVTAWADAIARLASDTELRTDFERHSHHAIGAYDWPVLAQRYVDLYSRAAGA